MPKTTAPITEEATPALLVSQLDKNPKAFPEIAGKIVAILKKRIAAAERANKAPANLEAEIEQCRADLATLKAKSGKTRLDFTEMSGIGAQITDLEEKIAESNETAFEHDTLLAMEVAEFDERLKNSFLQYVMGPHIAALKKALVPFCENGVVPENFAQQIPLIGYGIRRRSWHWGPGSRGLARASEIVRVLEPALKGELSS